MATKSTRPQTARTKSKLGGTSPDCDEPSSPRSPRCFLYGRMSTKKQERGDSFRRQTRLAENFCVRNNLPLDDELKLWDIGVSGWKGKNLTKKLGVLLEAIKQGRIQSGDFLLIEKTDRLTRDEVLPALNIFSQIINAGVTIIELEPETRYTKKSLQGFEIMLLISKFIVSNDHSERLSARIKEKYIARREQKGIISYVFPSWIRRNGEILEIIPEQKETIELIFRLALSGLGSLSILQHLIDNHIKPLSGKRWYKSAVTKLLRDKRLIGEYLSLTGHEDKAYFPVVIDETDFYKVQNFVTERNRNCGRHTKRVTNLFTGLLHNVADGSQMKLHQLVSSINYSLLVSQAALDKTAPFISVAMRPVETAILDRITELTSADFSPAIVPNDELDNLLGELAKTESTINEYQAAFDATPIDTLVPILRSLDTQKRNLHKQIEDIRQIKAVDAPSDLASIQKSIPAMLDCPPDELPEIRERIKNKLPSIIERVDMLVLKFGHLTRRVHFDTIYKSGSRRSFAIHIIRGQLVSIQDENREPLTAGIISELEQLPWSHKKGAFEGGKKVKW